MILFDADMIAMVAAFAAQKTKYVATHSTVVENLPHTHVEYFDDSKSAKEWAAANSGEALVWSRIDLQPESTALEIADMMIRDTLARTSSTQTKLFLSGPHNFRHFIASRAPYKGNRLNAIPPAHIKAVRQFLIDKWNAEVTEMEEADDAIARIATPDCVIVSKDKDFNQIPCTIYNFTTKEEVKVTPKEAVINFYSQVLSGDPVDNIPGIAGIGPVKAKKALSGCKSPADCWKVCVEMYKAAYGLVGAHYALETARLVKIGMPKGILWEPPK